MQAPVERNVQLPEPINPHTACALCTVHGLLLVTAEAAETTPEEAGADAAHAAAEQLEAAAGEEAPAPPTAPAQPAAALATNGGLTLQESPVEGIA